MKVLFKGNTTTGTEWLKYRKIGASSIHHLVESDRYQKGLIDKPEYSSPWILYQDLKGYYKPKFSDFMKDKLEFGHFAEDFIRDKFKEVAERQGIKGIRKTIKSNKVLGHSQKEYATCTLDGWVLLNNGKKVPLELKTGDSFQWDKWNGDTLPDKYYSQCQWILAITDSPFMYILGWINNRFTKVFKVERDENFINIIFNLAENFWNEHYLKDKEPELIGNKIEAEALGIIYEIPATEKKTLINTSLGKEEIKTLQDSLKEFKEIEKTSKKKIDSFKIRIKKEMLSKGINEMLVGNLKAKLNKRGALTIG